MRVLLTVLAPVVTVTVIVVTQFDMLVIVIVMYCLFIACHMGVPVW